jgi:hypothetical protein
VKRQGRPSKAQTPAPPKERIKGSSKNPSGSAASKKSAESIKLSPEVISVLEKKKDEYNEKHSSKVSLATLKAVFRRGAGAYSSSHRPIISGGKPNSRSAWAFARVNKFLKKKSGESVKKAYVQDDDLMAEGGQVGTLLAPNGRPSNLTPKQYKLVRTPEFKAWFGDWENDPENSSKVLDKKGEPLILYHGTNNKYPIFKNTSNFFSKSKDVALTYGKNIFEVFLNIRNPYYYDAGCQEYSEISGLINDFENTLNKIAQTNKSQIIRNWGELLIDKNIDGIIIENIVDTFYTSQDKEISDEDYEKWLKKWCSNNFLTINPNQIKLADGTNTTFNPTNPDIRFNEGGVVKDIPKLRDVAMERFIEAGFEVRNGAISRTDYGESAYFYVQYQGKSLDNFGLGIKVRVSDHSVTSFNRMGSELLIYKEADIDKAILKAELILRKDLFDKKEDVNEEQIERVVISGKPSKNSVPENYYNPETDTIIEDLGLSPKGNQKYLVKRKKTNISTQFTRKQYEKGGTINNSDMSTKIKHNQGSAGGYLVGNRHSRGGIKAVNKSTGQPLEMEGGEVVITRDAVNDETKREFNGKMMTNREILSAINVSGGGVSFEEGGKVPECTCSGRRYKYGGKVMRDYEIIHEMKNQYPSDFKKGVGEEMSEHENTFKLLIKKKLTPKEAAERVVAEHLEKKPDYYDNYESGGHIDIMGKKIMDYKTFQKGGRPIGSPYVGESDKYYKVYHPSKKTHVYAKGGNIRRAFVSSLYAYKNFLHLTYNITFNDLPNALKNALLQGKQNIVERYLNN